MLQLSGTLTIGSDSSSRVLRSGSGGDAPAFSDRELQLLLSDWQIRSEGACGCVCWGQPSLACCFSDRWRILLSRTPHPALELEHLLRCVCAAEIQIMKREDGSDWQLGSGGFGTVRVVTPLLDSMPVGT